MRKNGYMILIILIFFLLFIFCFSCSYKLKSTYLKANYFFQEGNKLYANEKYKEAKDYLNCVLKIDPGYHQALVYLNLLRRQMGLVDPLNKAEYIKYAKTAAVRAKAIR